MLVAPLCPFPALEVVATVAKGGSPQVPCAVPSWWVAPWGHHIPWPSCYGVNPKGPLLGCRIRPLLPSLFPSSFECMVLRRGDLITLIKHTTASLGRMKFSLQWRW